MVNIEINRTEIVIPDVKYLRVTPINSPFVQLVDFEGVSTPLVFQKIYYQLIRVYEDGREKVIEDENLDIPFYIYNKIALFLTNSATVEDIMILNGFFSQNGWGNIQIPFPETNEEPEP